MYNYENYSMHLFNEGSFIPTTSFTLLVLFMNTRNTTLSQLPIVYDAIPTKITHTTNTSKGNVVSHTDNTWGITTAIHKQELYTNKPYVDSQTSRHYPNINHNPYSDDALSINDVCQYRNHKIQASEHYCKWTKFSILTQWFCHSNSLT